MAPCQRNAVPLVYLPHCTRWTINDRLEGERVPLRRACRAVSLPAFCPAERPSAPRVVVRP